LGLIGASLGQRCRARRCAAGVRCPFIAALAVIGLVDLLLGYLYLVLLVRAQTREHELAQMGA
jgi:hypothetical protein